MSCKNNWFVKFMLTTNRDSRETSQPSSQEEYNDIAIREVSPFLPLSSASRYNARKEKALRIYLDGEWSSIEHKYSEKQLLNRYVWEHETFAYKVITSCQVFVESSTQQLQNILCFSKSSIFHSFLIFKAFWFLKPIRFVKFLEFVKYYTLPRDFRPRLSRFISMCFETIRIIKLPLTYGLLSYRISFKSTNTGENIESAK